METPIIRIVVGTLSLWWFGVCNYVVLSRRRDYKPVRKWAILGAMSVLVLWVRISPETLQYLIEAVISIASKMPKPRG